MAIDQATQQQQSEIKTLIIKGKEQGYLTYAEVNDHLPDDIVDPEQIEDIIGMINDMGIEVHEVAPDTETLLPETPVATVDDETATEEAVAVLSAVDMALKSGVPTKTHVLNLLHRLVDGKSSTPPTIDAPQALTLTNEPKANVERYDALRKNAEVRHAS